MHRFVSPRLIAPSLLLRKSDAELAALAAAGHDAAFTAIVLRHRPHLLRHCRRLLRDQRAEDAVQQTFVRALQALRSGIEVRELRPWLQTTAHNVALTELAARKRDHAELDDELEDHSRAGEYERRITLRDTLSAVEALPARQRVALLRSAAGDSPDAIGRDLGMTGVAVRQLVHRARVSVRAAVRVVCPPPLVWLARRAAIARERFPRVAGASAGAAPVASKIAVAVIATATIAPGATLLHSMLAHHPRPRPLAHPKRSAESVPVRVSLPVEPAARPVRFVRAAPAAPPRHARSHASVRRALASQARRHPSVSPGTGVPGVSASSPVSAPVAAGSQATTASAGAPLAADTTAAPPSAGTPIVAGEPTATGSDFAAGANGPTSTASASSPTTTSP